MKSFFKYIALLLCLNFIEGSKLFRCDYEYSSAANGWFKHHAVPATWSDARLQCDLESAVLASPTTPTMKATMRRIINASDGTAESYYYYEIFTGIHASFSKGSYHTIEGLPLTKIPQSWADNEPNNQGNNEDCLTFNINGDLADLSCKETRPFVCYRPDSTNMKINECGTVDPEYRMDNRTKKCYKFHPVPRVFSRAFLACSAEGGHLAIINSYTEASVLSDIFAKYPESSLVGMPWKVIAFIGIHDWNEHGDWRTIHGQTLAEAGYGKFSKENPDNAFPGQFCGAMYRSGELDDMFCDKLAAFICEKSPDYNAACALSEEELKGNAQ